MVYKVPQRILEETFSHFRRCGCGRRECQVLWLSSWDSPEIISKAVHPKHEAHVGGFVLDNAWLNAFWLELARENLGIRAQVHTHPGEAFHSAVDDEFPVIHTVHFLSLVIPRFGLRQIGLEEAFLTEIQDNGRWSQVAIAKRLVVT